MACYSVWVEYRKGEGLVEIESDLSLSEAVLVAEEEALLESYKVPVYAFDAELGAVYTLAGLVGLQSRKSL